MIEESKSVGNDADMPAIAEEERIETGSVGFPAILEESKDVGNANMPAMRVDEATSGVETGSATQKLI